MKTPNTPAVRQMLQNPTANESALRQAAEAIGFSGLGLAPMTSVINILTSWANR